MRGLANDQRMKSEQPFYEAQINANDRKNRMAAGLCQIIQTPISVVFNIERQVS
jgi:hypothetical protein